MWPRIEPSTVKKRASRKRRPPLAPGPPLQFVTAGHPDEFKYEETMRNVRSHVMYKHREQGEISSSESASGRERCNGLSTQPSADSFRSLAFRMLSMTTSSLDHSISSFLPASPLPSSTWPTPELLDGLKCDYIKSTPLFCHDQAWMETICNARLSLISHISAAYVYQDLSDGLLEDSAITVFAKAKVLRMISDSLNTEDPLVTITSILLLLISEIGVFDETVFEVHQQGLRQLISSIARLPPRLETFMTLLSLTFAFLRGQHVSSIPQIAQHRLSISTPHELITAVSPLYAPHGDLTSLLGHCSLSTYQILSTMQTYTAHISRLSTMQTYTAHISRLVRTSESNSTPLTPSAVSTPACTAHAQHICSLLLSLPPTQQTAVPDWIYESCRLAALIYCRCILDGDFAPPPRRPATPQLHPSSPIQLDCPALLSALHAALQQTDYKTCWGPPMHGCFLWVCLVAAGASWSLDLAQTAPVPPSRPAQPQHRNHPRNEHHARLPTQHHPPGEEQRQAALRRKSFTLHTVRAVASARLQHADALCAALAGMICVRAVVFGGAGAGAGIGLGGDGIEAGRDGIEAYREEL